MSILFKELLQKIPFANTFKVSTIKLLYIPDDKFITWKNHIYVNSVRRASSKNTIYKNI